MYKKYDSTEFMHVSESNLHVELNPDGTLSAELTLTDSDSDEPAEIRSDVADKSNEELVEFFEGERNTAEGTVVWAASGVVPVLNVQEGKFVAVGLRDGGAPSYKHHLTGASGMSDSVEDMLNPRRICIREGLEEILYTTTTDDGQPSEWIRPEPVEKEGLDTSEFIEPLYELWEQSSESTDHIFAGPDPELPDKLSRNTTNARVESIGRDELTINADGETRTIQGRLVIDPESGGVDIMEMMVVDLSEVSLSDIRLFDGEAFGGNLPNRDVFLFSLGEFINLTEGSESVNAHRRYKSGKLWNGSRWVDSYEDGTEPTIKNPLITPVIQGSGVPILETLKNQ